MNEPANNLKDEANMKVMIEAEVKAGGHDNKGFFLGLHKFLPAYWWPTGNDGEWMAAIRSHKSGPFPSEHAARAWVLAQLGAKEVKQ